VVTSRGTLCISAAILVMLSVGCNSGSTANVQNPPPPPPQAISIAFQPAPPTSVLVGSTTTLTAVVTNDTSNGGSGSGVDWNWTCANTGNCGSLSALHTASGQAVTYTPPPTLTGNSEIVNVTGFATANHSVNVLASINVTAFGSNMVGTYIIQVQGAQNGAPFQLVAAVVLDGNGNITSGEQTFNYYNSQNFISVTGTIAATGSSYFLGPDGRGSLTINPTSTESGTIGPQTFNLAFLSSQHLLVSAQPTNNNPLVISASGTMDLQSSTGSSTTPSGGYAFVMSGADYLGQGLTALGGVFNIDNQPNNANNISGQGSIADQYLYSFGTLSARLTLNGTISSPGKFGIVNLVLNDNSPSTTTLNLLGYIVDSTHIKLIEIDSGGSGDVAGIAIAQGSSTGTYLQSSFSTTYVFGLLGVDYVANVPDTFTAAGALVPNGSGVLTTGYADSAFETLQAEINGEFNGAYQSDPTGRFASFLDFTSRGIVYEPTLIFYLNGAGNPVPVLAYENNTGSFPFFATGIAYPQTGPFTFSGPYGLYLSQQDGIEYDGTGEMSATAPSFSGVADVGANTDQSFNGSYSSQSCSGAISGCFSGSFANSVGSSGLQGENLNNLSTAFVSDFFMIDSTQGFFVENDLTQQNTAQVSLGYFTASTAPQSPSSAKALKQQHK
jgi:hypothetical protein